MAALENKNIVSVSWGDHLVFGEGDGRLDSVDAVRRRMDRWKSELGAETIHWRATRNRIKGRFFQGRGFRHFSRTNRPPVSWDDFKEIPRCAHERGMKVFLYVALFDEGWPLLPKKIRQVSYHNKMHGFNMNPLEEDLARVYAPVFHPQDMKLYLARQWQPREPEKEHALLHRPCVAGLVFSSFRHDNPAPVLRNDWRA